MKKLFPVYVRIPVLFAVVLMALEYFIDSGDRPAFVKYPTVALFLGVFLFLLIAIEIVVSAIDKVTYSLLTEAQRKQLDEAQSVSITQSEWYKNLMRWLTKSRRIEEEGEVMLHHDYDGIHELDNVLPPWWVYLFYGTIIFGAIYLVRYHWMGADNQAMEFTNEMALAEKQIEQYKLTAPDLMDKEKVTLLTDQASLDAGKALFTTNCVACHRADGGGQIGPNLTDEFWINGGGIKNVFNTIMEGGRPGKGMVSWKAQIKPSDIQKIASYVLSLQGSKPANGKAPEGDKYVPEGGDKAAAPTTAAATVADSSATKS